MCVVFAVYSIYVCECVVCVYVWVYMVCGDGGVCPCVKELHRGQKRTSSVFLCLLFTYLFEMESLPEPEA